MACASSIASWVAARSDFVVFLQGGPGASDQLTSLDPRVAALFTKAYGRVLAPGLSALDPRLPEDVVLRSALTKAWRTFEQILDDYIQAQQLAA